MSNDYKNYIDGLKHDISIIDLVQRLNLKVYNANSKNPKVLCPFHKDTNPSLLLYPDTNSYHCFVCSAHGDIFSITKKAKEFSDFKDTLNWIAQEYNRPIPVFGNTNKTLDIDKNGFEIAFETYKKEEKSEKELRKIFIQSRGFSDDFFENAEIFAANKNKLLRKHKDNILYKEKLLEKSLLKNVLKNIQEQESMQDVDPIDTKDTFTADRIIFTIRNASNSIVGFAGRAITDTKEPKYLYNKDLPKGNLLYRLNALKQKINKDKDSIYHIYLTEGFLDALRLEERGFNAIAVLGSSLTTDQSKVLIDFFNDLKTNNKIIHIHLFFDSDKAGINGTYKTLEILWNNSQTRGIYIDVIIPPNKDKDPDSFLKMYNGDNKLLLEKNTITVFDFLFAYYMKLEIELFIPEDIYNSFNIKESSEKYYILSMIAKMLPKSYWESIVSIYNFNNQKDISLFYTFKNFISAQNETINVINTSNNESTKILYHAFSVARNSYFREEIPLDESTWERIDKCFDLFYEYFSKIFAEGKPIEKPIVGIKIPKGEDEFRLKVLFCHEKLLMQQYILNELLVNRNTLDYAELIPAVRYSMDREKNKESIITTGHNISEVFKENDVKAVSFAYQINTSVIDGLVAGKNGMFKNYYLCWQDFINFIHDGINHINSDNIYKVRLDIHKFYDALPIRAVQNVLYDCLREALKISGSGSFFNLLFNTELEPGERAIKICDWICKEIFNYEYLSPKTGSKEQYTMKDCGIPQGPNLSAYLANISLFPLDVAVQKYVVSVNSANENTDIKTVHVRYARYVDDMVIIADDPKHILKVKSIIENELRKIELELSVKTEPAIEVKKIDAIEWLTEERGGLSVSQGSDIPESDYKELINDSYDYEILNRKDALTILNNSIYTFKSNTQDKKLEEDALKVLFRTNEAKYRDVIRIAELMWNHILNFKEENDIILTLDEYFELWGNLKDRDENRSSLFVREDVRKMSALDGIENILKKDITKEYSLSEDEKQRMCEKLLKISRLVLSQQFITYYTNEDILENKYAIKCKLLNLVCLGIRNLSKDAQDISELRIIINELYDNTIQNKYYELSFLLDFQYTLRREIQDLSLNAIPRDNGDVLSLIHYVINKMEIRDIPNLNNVLPMEWIDYSPNDDTPEYVLYYCMKMWIRNEAESKSEKSLSNIGEPLEKIALYSIVNILNKEIIAEILSRNDILRKYLFTKNIENIIPVPPGINYNGIFGIRNFTGDKLLYAERVDFNNNSIDNNIKWIEEKVNGLRRYKANLENSWQSLNEYFYNKVFRQNDLEDIAKIYKNIYDYIKINKENKKLVLSKYNIFIDKDYNIIILSYRINGDRLISPAYVSCGINGIVPNEIPKEGESYWAIGTVMADALNLLPFQKKNHILSLNCSINGGTKEYIDKMLYNSMYRLQALWMNNTYTYTSDKSIEYTVNRALENMHQYSKLDDKCLQLGTLDIISINKLISWRMNEENLILMGGKNIYIIAKMALNFLSFEYHSFLESLSIPIDENLCLPKRQSAKAFAVIAYKFDYLLKSYDSNFSGLNAVRCGLFIYSIFISIKMQVLELIYLLAKDEVYSLLETDFPIDYLKIDISKTTLFLCNNNQAEELKIVVTDLLFHKNNNLISKITPIGWVLLLSWLMGVGAEKNYKTKLQTFNAGNPKKSRTKNGDKIVKVLINDLCFAEDQKDEGKFPFDGIEDFINKYNVETFEKHICLLNDIDELNNIKVVERINDFFSYIPKKMNGLVSINLPNKTLSNLPLFFITHSKMDENDRINQTEDISDNKIWSESYFEDAILGVSIVSSKVSNLYKSNKYIKEINDEDGSTEPYIGKFDQKDIFKGPSTKAEPVNEIVKLSFDENTIKNESGKLKSNIKLMTEFSNLQNDCWRSRKKNIETYDRIALFQFDVDESYSHPLNEICTIKNKELVEKNEKIKSINELKNNPEGWTSDFINAYNNGKNHLKSCAECRRRVMLEKVLDTCEIFGVDILLLPEYSVRQETVIHLRDYMERNKYNVNIWAGTLRISPNTMNAVFGEVQKCSAVLPRIIKITENGVDRFDINLDRLKKYPSPVLEEAINPLNYTTDLDSLIIKKIMRQNKSKKIFNKAVNDITELICSEVFFMNCPANWVTLSKISYDLSRKFSQGIVEWKDYYEKTIKDIQLFGERTSFINLNERDHRTPIILVPSFTSRTIDFTLTAQISYLSAGLTTVFCNAVATKKGIGGSCFIGTECWDDFTKRVDNTYESDYSIYHGINPGIYHQFANKRGNLGEKEQALLICDVNPLHPFSGKPNPVTLTTSLNLVAHLPVIEFAERNDKVKKDCRCQQYVGNNDILANKMEELLCALKKNYVSTLDDKNPEIIKDCLNKIGNEIKNEWLVERGKSYFKGHINNPQKWPPPTAIDMLLIDIDFENYTIPEIEVPEFINGKNI